MWIVLWDPFLMKKLIKSGVCGIVNSAQVHCSQKNRSTIAAEKKKKKKNWGNADAALISAIQTSTKCVIFN